MDKYLRECPSPQKWHNTGPTEPHSVTVSPLVAARNSWSAALTGQLDGFRSVCRSGPGDRDHVGVEFFAGGLFVKHVSGDYKFARKN